jgi:acetoin:2,6-dichlorophenolindophenol oxidoreductase subunit alpha
MRKAAFMVDTNLELYRKMFLIRKTEEAIREHYFDDEMKTPMHMSMGSEAISAGVCQALSPRDQILGTYRSHGIYLAKTMEVRRFFAEMYGRATGTSKGKAGSMHLIAPEHGLLCTSAIVASTIPVAIGVAFANKMQKNGIRTAVFFGDGAIDEGAFWESLNAACLWNLPVMFVCEDNGLAVHTPAHRRHGYHDITDIVAGFDCDVYCSDSTDAEVIFALAREALERMGRDLRPAFMHLKYYRYLEHVGVNEDFNAGYRKRDEFDEWSKKDPLPLQRGKLLISRDLADIEVIEKQITKEIEDALIEAGQAPFPEDNVLIEDVYA